jgi:hypothetical protein
MRSWAKAVCALGSVLLLAATPAKRPEVRLSFRSKAGNGLLWVHRPATMRVFLKGQWPMVAGLAWNLEVEGAPRASGTVFMDAPGQPQREFEKTLEVSDEDYAAARTIGPPEWMKADLQSEGGFKSTRRRLLMELSIRNGETNELLGKGQTEVMIEPVPMNRR